MAFGCRIHITILEAIMPLFGHMTDGVIFYVIGLAPEIPEDLYMLIKKVLPRSFFTPRNCFFF